ncbi:DUF4157 domain-containing protein [Rheinheimera hassiensis]|uniref:eCIS core domain-containing protein n=1 Tax=Rheinheimera hassiensis TaxID=1193627 RepID=UPI001F05E001|nr:DUF4157 domain-containing protein [Rheinheimera hassiensis]
MIQHKLDESTVSQQAALEDEEPMQGKFDATVQRQPDEEDPLQGKFEPGAVNQRQADAAPANNTGMPDQLKSGIESLSGYAMDDVKVHYNSAKPATIQAHAYAQGSDIHIAPGQEQHLPHEAWHVVQQKQGRVKATTQLKGEAINDDLGLEHEADVMGARAFQRKAADSTPVADGRHLRITMQRKGRIDLSKVQEDKKEEIKTLLEQAKAKKKNDKKIATSEWAKADGKDISRDESYNDKILKARQEYEQKIKAIAATAGEGALVSGAAYYGNLLPGTSKVYKRPDNSKEYVKDKRGTFVPRYVRRELNKRDKRGEDLTPTGIGTYSKLDSEKNIDVAGNSPDAPLSWEHREFLQQSAGGGGNQFAFSHTSTKRPILSNDHKSFGADPNGAILTDLSGLDTNNIAAQWEIDPADGHKKSLASGKLASLGFKARKGDASGDSAVPAAEREKTVLTSGYRNMEVVTANVPNSAVKHTWDGAEGPKTDYDSGESARGKGMVEKREEFYKK